MNHPRDLAVRILTRVLSERQPLDEALAALSGEASPAARGWLHEVCSGTLRWRGRLDAVIDSTALKKKPSGWLRKMLLVAAYQLVAQDRTQPAAVVRETVEEIKKREGEPPARFANASLRKIAEHASQWRSLAYQAGASAKEGASWGSLPEWLWTRLVNDHGEEWAKAYALASLERPTIWIRAREGAEVAEWTEPGPVPGSFRLKEGGAIFEKPGFREGRFFVQDISSQRLVSEISARALQGAQGPATALDLCAAPGGKSVGLAWSGLQVSSSDRDASRYALLAATVERAAPGIRVVPRDEVGTLPPQDLVWVDAPCSGTGILRRHPDVRWLRQEKELPGLLKVQQELLAEAWTCVKPGGFLAYSVCSVLKQEGPEALGRFMESQRIAAAARVQKWFFVPQDVPGGDGFWAGLVQKAMN